MTSETFIFFEEGTLTNLDAVVYEFKHTTDYPIILSTDGSDLELLIDGTKQDALDLLNRLEKMQLISLDSSFEMEDIVQELYGKPICFNRDLSRYCTIDLRKLESECNKIYWSDLRLADSRWQKIEDFIDDFPEFLLDFGEYLEEQQTSFYINSTGVFKPIISKRISAKSLFQDTCTNFLILETLPDVLQVFSSPDTVISIEKAFEIVFAGIFKFAVESFKVTDLGVTGANSFLSLVNSAKNSSPLIFKGDLFEMYHGNVFKDNNVRRNFLIEVRTCSNYDLRLSALEMEMGRLGLNRLDIRKGVSGDMHGNVHWDFKGGLSIENPSKDFYIIHLSVHPRYGAFQ